MVWVEIIVLASTRRLSYLNFDIRKRWIDEIKKRGHLDSCIASADEKRSYGFISRKARR
jgi:hypothetical protein